MKKISLLPFISCIVILVSPSLLFSSNLKPEDSNATHRDVEIFFSYWNAPYAATFNHNTSGKEIAHKQRYELETFETTANVYELNSVTEKAVPLPFSSITEQRTIFTVNFKQGPIKNLAQIPYARRLIFLTAEQEKNFEAQLSAMKQTQTVESFELSKRT